MFLLPALSQCPWHCSPMSTLTVFLYFLVLACPGLSSLALSYYFMLLSCSDSGHRPGLASFFLSLLAESEEREEKVRDNCSEGN